MRTRGHVRKAPPIALAVATVAMLCLGPGRLAVPTVSAQADNEAPILFVHGICSDATTWHTMIQSLQSRYPGRYGSGVTHLYYDDDAVWQYDGGNFATKLTNRTPAASLTPSASRRVFTIDFFNQAQRTFSPHYVNDVSLSYKAYELRRVIEEVARLSGHPKVIVVGHSQGGVIARAYVEGLATPFTPLEDFSGTATTLPYRHDQPTRNNVFAIVTIATPHRGVTHSDLAVDVPGLCAGQVSRNRNELAVNHRFIRTLNEREIPVPLLSVAVWPSAYPCELGDGVVSLLSQDVKGTFRREQATNDTPVCRRTPARTRYTDTPHVFVDGFSSGGALFGYHSKVLSEAGMADLLARRVANLDAWNPPPVAVQPPAPLSGFLTGRVLIDANGNGLPDAGETFAAAEGTQCANATVVPRLRITWAGPSAGNAAPTQCVDDPTFGPRLAAYSSPAISTGTYAVSLITPPGWRVTRSFVASGHGDLSSYPLTAGANHIWFAIQEHASSTGDFLVEATPVHVTVEQGQVISFDATVRSIGGLAGTVAMSARDLPGHLVLPGTQWTPATVSVPSDGGVTSRLTLVTNTSTPVGLHTIRLHGSGAGRERGVPVTVRVERYIARPGAPELNPPSVSGSNVQLSWTPGEGPAPTSYTVEASVVPQGPAVATIPAQGTTFSVVAPLGTYYVRVTARNAHGVSPPSNEVVLAVQQTPVPMPAITGIVPSAPVASLDDQTVVVQGSGFDSRLRVHVEYPGGEGELSGAQIVNVTPTSAEILATLANPGSYVLRIVNPNGMTSSPFAFTVVARGPAQLQTVKHLSPATGQADSRLVQGQDGWLYGLSGTTTVSVYRVSVAPVAGSDEHAFEVVYTFDGSLNPVPTGGELAFGGDGRLYSYGQLASGLRVIYALTIPTASLEIVHSFTDAENGQAPVGTPIVMPDGRIVGVTSGGGAQGGGVLFERHPNGTFNVLHHFGGPTRSPLGVKRGSDGTFYGFTAAANGPSYGSGTGAIWSYSATEGFRTLHVLQQWDPDTQRYPDGVLVNDTLAIGADGTLFGAATYGGLLAGVTNGALFRLTPSTNVFEVMYSFPAAAAGQPTGALAVGPDGRLYGEVHSGPYWTPLLNAGAVFRFDPATRAYALLHEFTGPDGGGPIRGLTVISASQLFGVTGTNGLFEFGTIFRILNPFLLP